MVTVTVTGGYSVFGVNPYRNGMGENLKNAVTRCNCNQKCNRFEPYTVDSSAGHTMLLGKAML